MENVQFANNGVDYIELYVPVAKPFVYWHTKALGFSVAAYSGAETGRPGIASYLLTSGSISLVVTATYPLNTAVTGVGDISPFVYNHSCGVKRIAFQVSDVKAAFNQAVAQGGIPVRFPSREEDDMGYIEEAAIKLYDHGEIVFVDRSRYSGLFKPGYKASGVYANGQYPFFKNIDHIASELRINEVDLWTGYLKKVLNTKLIQEVGKSTDNKTGMKMNISQTLDMESIFVMTESEDHSTQSRVQQSVEKFGPGIHHIAFTTDDIISTIRELKMRHVEVVEFPAAYYDMLRNNDDLKNTDIDIDLLQELGILVDKEGDAFLLQKFLKPMGDRPYFFYEIIQRVNGYSGFALNNITALRKAEEVQITQVAAG